MEVEADRLETQGRLGDALAIYQGFLKLHPNSLQALNNASMLCLMMRNPLEARQLAERATRLDPKYVRAWNNLGNARRMCGDVVGARQALARALELDPTNQVATKSLQALVRSGGGTGGSRRIRFEQAARTCGRCTKDFREDRGPTDSRAIGGLLCRRCGRFYCEDCVTSALQEDAFMSCSCGEGTARIDEKGEFALQDFDERVVYE